MRIMRWLAYARDANDQAIVKKLSRAQRTALMDLIGENSAERQRNTVLQSRRTQDVPLLYPSLAYLSVESLLMHYFAHASAVKPRRVLFEHFRFVIVSSMIVVVRAAWREDVELLQVSHRDSTRRIQRPEHCT
jgi:hypothetical protein